MISRLAARLSQRGLRDSLKYFLGRFESVRSIRRASGPLFRGMRPQLVAAPQPVIEPFDVDGALAALVRDSVFTGLRLPAPLLAELQTEVDRADQQEAHQGRPVDAAMLARSGDAQEPVLIVNLQSPRLRSACMRVACDPQLLAVATRFLGRPPARGEIRVQRSEVTQASVAYRESRNQTVMFHYDVHDLDFLYVFFYLTDTTVDTGAHELMRGTHRGKKWRHLFASARQHDEEVYAVYGEAKSLVIEGSAGTGFIEDTSCFHRAIAPVKAPRVALQIRFS
jgi:hypothetical protein